MVRNMALLLRPSMLDDLGLVPALQWQGREVSKRTGLRVRVAAEGVSDDLPEEHKTCIYRIVQESLHNCAQHAGGDHGACHRATGGGMHPPHHSGRRQGLPSRSRERGMGLLGIEERAANLGGTFSIDTQPGQGATVSIVLPGPAPTERTGGRHEHHSHPAGGRSPGSPQGTLPAAREPTRLPGSGGSVRRAPGRGPGRRAFTRHRRAGRGHAHAERDRGGAPDLRQAARKPASSF